MNEHEGRYIDARWGVFRFIQERHNWAGTSIQIGRVWDRVGFYVCVGRWTLQVVVR